MNFQNLSYQPKPIVPLQKVRNTMVDTKSMIKLSLDKTFDFSAPQIQMIDNLPTFFYLKKLSLFARQSIAFYP